MKAGPSLALSMCLAAWPALLRAQETPPVQRVPGHALTNVSSLQGTISNSQTKLGIPGVEISLLRDGKVIVEQRTNAEGIFRFIGVPPGIYELKARREGFRDIDLPSLQIKDPGNTRSVS